MNHLITSNEKWRLENRGVSGTLGFEGAVAGVGEYYAIFDSHI